MQADFEAEKQARLAALPAAYGFADVASFVGALRAAAGAKPPRQKGAGKPKRRARAVPAQTSSIAAEATAPVTSQTPLPPVAAASDSLADPVNFSQLPDRMIFEQGDRSASVQRDRLSTALRFCTQVLHTSKVRATVWREWRTFERELQDALRAVHPA